MRMNCDFLFDFYESRWQYSVNDSPIEISVNNDLKESTTTTIKFC